MLAWQGGAALRAEDQSGWDALMAACHSGHTRMVTVWVQGADLSRAARDGSTCLHAAARGGHGALVKLLLQHGADPAARDRTGKRALELARAAGHVEAVALLEPATPILAEAPAPHPTATRPAAWLIALGVLLAAIGVVMMRE